MYKIAIHQTNFVPWFPYFYKMALADRFIILRYVQFEKNGYQNRFNLSDGRWITKPVWQGKEPIYTKDYVGLEKNGRSFSQYDYPKHLQRGSLYHINMLWIQAIKQTLHIDTEIIEENNFVQAASEKTDATERLITLIRSNGGTTYITNPEAKDKYLKEELMRASNINIEYFKCPRHLRKSIFEVIMENGIEGTINQLPKKSSCKV